MIDSAFLHLSGIGKKNLQKIQKLGIQTWQELFENIHKLKLKTKSLEKLEESLIQSQTALLKEDIFYFTKKLHPKDKWKILAHYYNEILYFDIETDQFQRITLIGCYYKQKEYAFLRYANIENFLDLLEHAKLVVSFNGSSFDIPILLKYFHLPEFPVPHIDLRWVLYHKGIKGGLKQIELQLGIEREKEIQNLNGMDAVFLWYRYHELGEIEAKNLLIRYCMADVISLKKIVDLLLEK